MDPGTILYRNLDHAFNKLVETGSCKRKILVDMQLNEHPNGFLLQARDDDGYTFEKELTCMKEPASNPERMLQALKEQLAKTGDTVFIVHAIEINWQQPCFLPISTINALRRDVLSGLEAARIAGYRRTERQEKPAIAGYHQTTIDYRGNVSNDKAAEFYRKRQASSILPAFESDDTAFDGVLMTTRYCLKYELGECPSKQSQTRGTSFSGPLYLEDSNRRYRLVFDCSRCEMKVMLDTPAKE
jgi:putative protease